ncbi:ABC transporter ATP-binding protein [Halopelagius longus]|uniref:ABC-type D-xylose/L-arabinose transporter n=1 Tax=Halopelagius longus TaxID=1236180 RepID=A0A1H1FP77_9EURY|nr:ABC transporter ATP-binding protein [Halopelagius longus]RDI70017.1 ABC transporter ATP-binding protein [Halopelagius longus]SDR02346.1 carbohydrate ABC transporter ATP-binding protein, CUT1 family [Halopelagius longus]
MGEIEIDNLTKRFGSTTAVDGLSLDIEDGEFLVLVGPSGCGKSTTLRCLAGLESESSGDIYIAGDHMNYRVPQNRDIAMVFQDYALYPHMTVRQNMRFGLEEEEGYTAEERDERVEEIGEMLGIANLLDRKPDELSGGQQQRVALGRAIVRDPEVFLMDEPLSNLDAKLRAQMRTELQRLQNRFGVTTVYVTHNQTEAMTMGDRIAVMNDGELQQVGEPLELYHAPANRFVAGFIGEPMMNFLEGTYDDGVYRGEHIEYPFDEQIREHVDGASEVVLGVRPEDVELHPARDGAEATLDDHQFLMEVAVVEPHGNQNIVYLNPVDETGTETLLQAVVGGTDDPQPGMRVIVGIDPETVHVFDARTGEALHNRRFESEREVTV